MVSCLGGSKPVASQAAPVVEVAGRCFEFPESLSLGSAVCLGRFRGSEFVCSIGFGVRHQQGRASWLTRVFGIEWLLEFHTGRGVGWTADISGAMIRVHGDPRKFCRWQLRKRPPTCIW